jgi:hypothetical protein
MSFLAGIKVFGTDIEKAFSWFGSTKGQAVVAGGEATVEAIVPASTPIVDLFNEWAAKAYNVEALAVAAGQATGTGEEKAALVSQAIAPVVLQYAQSAGLPARTAAQIAAANTAAISFINAMTQPPAA